MSEVIIIQRRLTDYRVPVFDQLRGKLAEDGVRLRLLHGEGTEQERSKGDAGHLAWAESLPARYLASGRVCWQPFGARVRGADLVIVTQENKLICNLWPLFGPRRYRLAFWGHGANLQAASADSMEERFKRITTNRVDWWFAYTGLSVKLVTAQGFARARVTNLENTVDTEALRRLCDAVGAGDIAAQRAALRMPSGPVGLFVGSLYPEKRLDFLLEAGGRLAATVPGFTLVVVGDGPMRPLVEAKAIEAPWLRYVGRRSGRDKAVLLRMADVVLNPGLVGLGILDSFVAGTPMFTTDCGLHSPEIDYLVNSDNGVMTANDLEAYVRAVTETLTNPARSDRLSVGCRRSAGHYTVANMVDNFRVGIRQALMP